MKFWIGVTDNNWYQFLRSKKPDEVNFWRPSGRTQFKAIEPGALFLFKLKRPYNHIAGGGFFVRHSILPLSLAWQAFGEKNGASSYNSLSQIILNLRHDQSPNPMIGCSVLTDPFFLPEPEWIPAPRDWSSNIVQGKTYDTDEHSGRRIWNEVMERMKLDRDTEIALPISTAIAEPEQRYGSEFLTKARLGQGAFRILVTDSYNRRCAVTGEKTLPVLEAAHIKPFVERGPNRINNGILLRSDLHILFDRGYLTVTDNFHVEISGRIREEFENGRDYYALHGKRFEALPNNIIDRPASEFINWHNENIYRP